MYLSRREFLNQILNANRLAANLSGKVQARNLAYYDIAEETLLDPNAPSGVYLTVISNSPLSPDPASNGSGPPPTSVYIDIAAVLAQPLSRGNVHIKSSNSLDTPIIDPRLLGKDVDIEVFAELVLYIHTISRSPPFSGLFKQPLKPCPSTADFTDLDAAKEYSRARTTSMWHPVYGLENIRVVDASVAPLLPPGSLQSTVYALAEKAADLIKMDYGLKTAE
ncbi:GMC oxidoreductase-domain-containing protein [Daldinia sp. FL1419]|nr:GMC oxidoreductase-domain-containing protein [Daldinia sp. FL1419]